MAKAKKAVVKKKPNPVLPNDEWHKVRAKGKCTNCQKRKAKAPFLWCATCARECS